MKAVGCVVLVAVVAVGGFVAVVLWTLGRGEDQTSLTSRVEVTVVGEPRDVGQAPSRSWRFDYAYQVDGQWYAAEGDISTDAWRPGRPLAACADPSDPTRHVLQLRGSCGEETVRSGSIDEAVPTSAPDGSS